MKTFLLSIFIFLSAAASQAVNGTFIQLNRSAADKTLEDWRNDLEQMADIGIDTLIVQWSGEPPVLYFDDQNPPPYFSETYPVLETLFAANRDIGHEIYIGLLNNPLFWSQIKGREEVLRDFFLIRTSRNEMLQRSLLEAFGQEKKWVGYYIPDEIDDLTWRHSSKRPAMKTYVTHMCSQIRANDPTRAIAMSTFFRGRTAPTILAENLLDICENTGLDYLLIQDGIGVGDPPVNYVPFYFKILTDKWTSQDTGPTPILDFMAEAENENNLLRDSASPGIPNGGDAKTVQKPNPPVSPDRFLPETETGAPPLFLPELWVVLEAFQQQSGEGEPFTASPASPDTLEKQLHNAHMYFENIVFFTFQDYLDPDLGEDEAQLFDLIRKINGQRISAK